VAGRKPKPTILKLITGNPGRRPLNDQEPQPPAGLPDPPGHLTAIARTEWDRLAPKMCDAGMLTHPDRAALAGYCQAYSDWVEHEENLRKYGKLVKSPSRKITRRRKDGTEVTETSGGFPMQSPYLAMRNKALELMLRFAVELGLTPSSRSRVIVAKPPSKEDPAAKYFVS
jgi:P27 family predicted phage terminase small subunit